MFVSEFLNFVIVDLFGVAAYVVFDEFVHAAGEIQRVPVRQVPAMRQGHAQNGVARMQRGHVHGDVRGSAGVGLHVDVIRAEELLGAVNGQLLHLVGEFTPTVIASARDSPRRICW